VLPEGAVPGCQRAGGGGGDILLKVMTTNEGFSYFITTYKIFASCSCSVEDNQKICLQSIPARNENLRRPGICGSEG